MTDNNGKQIIIKMFKKYKNFFLQRHALIALQTIQYKTILNDVQHFLQPESIGIFKSLKSMQSQKYVIPPPSVKYTDLVREISFYV